MLLPLYIVVALVNIFAKNNNYYIKTPRNPDFDIRVKREAPDIDFDGLTELKNEDKEKSVILDELNELLKIYIGYDENNTNSKKTRKVYSPINIVSDVDTGVGVKELNNNAKVWKEITFKIDELKDLIKHNDYDETNTNANKRVWRDADSVIHIEGDLNSNRIELEDKEKVLREIASKNIENLWNNITAEMSKLAELAVQYDKTKVSHDTVFDTKVKREADSVKTVNSEESISAEVNELKYNAKAWKEIASVVDEIKDLITEYNNYSGNTPIVNIRVRRVADSTKIIDSDVNTSVGITEPKNAKVLTEIESVLNQIQELISEYRNSISDLKEPKIPDLRVKREVNAPLQLNYYGAGLLGTMVGNALGYNKITIGGKDTKLRDRKILNIPMKNIGKSPDGTYLEKMLPYEKPVERLASKDKKVNKILPQEQEVGSKEIGIEDVTLKEKLEDGLLNKNELGSIPQQNDAAEEILSKEVYPTDTRLQDKLILLNGNEIKKVPEDKDTNPPEDLIVKFVTKSNNDEGEVKPNIDFVKVEQIDTNDLKNYDGIQTYKILEAFDDIEDLLEIYVQESSVEEEKIMDDKGVIKHTESGQVYELVADYTDEYELKVDAKSITPRIKNVSFNKYRTKEKQMKPMLKTAVRNMKQNKSETNNRLKVTNSNSNLINHLKQNTNVRENVEPPKRNLLKILKEPKVLNIYRVKRDASPENRVSNFFSNIYTKVYDITHPKKDEDVNNNLLLRDDNYNSYGSLHHQNNINNNQNGGYNQYEKNRINDNSLTHSDYTSYNNNNGYNNPVYNSPTNTYGYNTYGYRYGYNTPTNGHNTNSAPYDTPRNGFNTNAPTYNYNYANGYYYNQPINGSVYSSNGYPYNTNSGYNNSNNNYNYGTGYGYSTSANNGYSYNSKQDNDYGYSTTQDNGYGYSTTQDNSYGYNITQDNGYGYNATQDNGYGYNATQDNGYGYNATVVNDLNNNDTSTEGTIVQGCIFCGNFGCQRNYRWMGVACVPIKG